MSKISFVIQYAGLSLPVVKNEQGVDMTRIKPISDLFGLKWQDQRKKLTESPFLVRHLGLSFVENGQKKADSGMDDPTSNGDSGTHMCTSNPTYLPEVWVRVDRVASYLMTVNPNRVRALGNESGADYLEAKYTEWADALHDFIEVGVAVNTNHIKQQEQTRKLRTAFFHAMGVQNKTENPAARKAIGQVVQQMAAELGVAYQPDLTA